MEKQLINNNTSAMFSHLHSMFKVPKIIWLLGFTSGFTLLISGSILNFWLAQEHIDKSVLGCFTLVSLPYALGFLWAPLLDMFTIPVITKYLGHRLSWVMIMELLLIIALYHLSNLSPQTDLGSIAIIATIITALSVTKDVILGALRSELLTSQMQIATSGLYILSYRIGMLLASTGSTALSQYVSWQTIFRLIALGIMFLGLLLIFLRSELAPSQPQLVKDDQNSILAGLQNLGSLKFLGLLFAFLLLYRLPDHFITTMINPLLLELGYSGTVIASFGKGLGLSIAAVGGLFASYWMHKLSIANALRIFGIIHAISHLAFTLLKTNNWFHLLIINSISGFTSGMTMAAYITLISILCQGKYRATKYAVLTATMGISRAIFPSISGLIVIKYGWNAFFIAMTLGSLPALVCLQFLQPYLRAFEHKALY